MVVVVDCFPVVRRHTTSKADDVNFMVLENNDNGEDDKATTF